MRVVIFLAVILAVASVKTKIESWQDRLLFLAFSGLLFVDAVAIRGLL